MESNVRDTSVLAYYKNIPKISKMQRMVLEEIVKHEDVTNSELSDALKIKISSITGRTNELVRQKGIVVEGRKRKCKSTGELVQSWRIKTEQVRFKVREKQKFQQSLI